MEFHIDVREEDGSYWAEVRELPGCFASGASLDELKEAVVEAITLYLADDERPRDLSKAQASAQVDEMRVLLPA